MKNIKGYSIDQNISLFFMNAIFSHMLHDFTPLCLSVHRSIDEFVVRELIDREFELVNL